MTADGLAVLSTVRLLVVQSHLAPGVRPAVWFSSSELTSGVWRYCMYAPSRCPWSSWTSCDTAVCTTTGV